MRTILRIILRDKRRLLFTAPPPLCAFGRRHAAPVSLPTEIRMLMEVVSAVYSNKRVIYENTWT